MQNINVILLAAGKGSRLNCIKNSKVLKKLAGKPMISYTLFLLKSLHIPKKDIFVVVSFDKAKVIKTAGRGYNFVDQKQTLGTAHAFGCALKKINGNDPILVLQADDSAFYKSSEIDRLISDHIAFHNDLTFLTVEKSNPSVARVLRDRFGNLTKIVEEKNATPNQLKVKEVNTAVYVFNPDFARNYLPKIKKNIVTGEFHLPDFINLGLKNSRKVMAVKASDNSFFQSVNTKEEWIKADNLMKLKKRI